MELVSFNKKSEIICVIMELLNNGYDEINADDLIEIYKANKKAEMIV